jgi:hypothetical protein
MHKITKEKARPRIAGTGIGREKSVVVKKGDFALEKRAPKQNIMNPR